MSDLATHYFILDLKDDPALIAEYEAHHANVWPEIIASIKESGIVSMEIFRAGNRLMMVMKTNQAFSMEQKIVADAENPKVFAWENLMWHYQQALPFAKSGEKWIKMNQLFELL